MTKLDQEITVTFSRTEKKIIELVIFPQLSEFNSNAELQLLGKELVKIQKFLGCKKPLGEDAEDDLVSHLLEFFGDFTIAEINRSVKLAAAGELELDDNEHYERFGVLYLSKILKLYRRIRNQVVAKYRKLELEKIQALNDKLSPEEIEIINWDGCLRRFEEFKKDKYCHDLGNATFNYLFKIGIFQKLNDADKSLLRDRALERMKIVAAYSQNKNEKKVLFELVEQLITQNDSTDARLKSHMKNILLNDYFTQLISDGKELSILMSEKIGQKEKLSKANSI